MTAKTLLTMIPLNNTPPPKKSDTSSSEFCRHLWVSLALFGSVLSVFHSRWIFLGWGKKTHFCLVEGDNCFNIQTMLNSYSLQKQKENMIDLNTCKWI